MNDPRNHDAVSSDLAGYALDALEEDARRLVEEHLTECDDCTSELAQLMEGAGNLAFAVPSVTPPDYLLDRLRAALEGETARMASESPAHVATEETVARPGSRPAAEGLAPTPAPLVAVRNPWYASPRLAWGVSAGIAAAFVGVVALSAVFNTRLNDRIDTLSAQVAAQDRDVATMSASVSVIEQKAELTQTDLQRVSVLQVAADTLEQQATDLRLLQYVPLTSS